MAYFIGYFSALIMALSIHEWAHAYIAYKNGDHTAKVMGRMTLAPFAHIDIWGLLCLWFIGFGWAKPVPVDARNFKKGKTSALFISLAGIMANLVVGTIAIIILCAINQFAPNFQTDWGVYGTSLHTFLNTSIQINFVLMFFNLLPIYPLDGFRVIETYANPNSGFVNFMRRYSSFILIAVVFFSPLLDYYFSFTAYNLIDGITYIFTKLFGLLG